MPIGISEEQKTKLKPFLTLARALFIDPHHSRSISIVNLARNPHVPSSSYHQPAYTGTRHGFKALQVGRIPIAWDADDRRRAAGRNAGAGRSSPRPGPLPGGRPGARRGQARRSAAARGR